MRRSRQTPSVNAAHSAACDSCALRPCPFRRFESCGVRSHRSLARGDRLERAETGACLRFWILVDGTAATCAAFRDGRRQIVSLESAGDAVCVPMAGYSTENWLEALTDCTVCDLDMSACIDVLGEDPNFMASAFRLVHDRLEAAADHISMLGRLDSQERVTLFLAVRAAEAEGPVVALPMSREDIADYLGLNSETVIRILGRLKKSGLVRFLSPTEFVLPDPAKIARRLPMEIPVPRARTAAAPNSKGLPA